MYDEMMDAFSSEEMSVLDECTEAMAAVLPDRGLRVSEALGGKVDARRYEGTVDTVSTLVRQGVTGTTDAYPVEGSTVLDVLGTIFSPAQFLRIGKHIVAGPVFHRQVEVKELFQGDDSLGMFYLLKPYAAQVMLLSLGRTDMESVQSAAAAAFGIQLDNVAVNRRCGISIAEKIVIDNRLADGIIGLNDVTLTEAVPVLGKYLRCEVTLENVSGLRAILVRTPVTEKACAPHVRIVRMDAPERGCYMNDVTAKAMGGDGDGDPVVVTLSLKYGRKEARKDLGSMTAMGVKTDPTAFGTLTWAVQDAQDWPFQSGKEMAVGLAVKTLFQGLITNYFARVAAVGVVLCQRDEKFLAASAARVGLSASTNWLELSSAIQDKIKQNETLMTEVIMDFRKFVLGDKKQFSDQLFAIVKAAGRQSKTWALPTSLTQVIKAGKAFELESVNAVLAYLGSLRPADALEQLPLQNCIVGGGIRPTKEARLALAQTVSSMGVSHSLEALAGLCLEERVKMDTRTLRENEAEPFFAQEFPTYQGDAWSFVIQAVQMASKGGYRTLKTGVAFNLPHGEIVLPWDLTVSSLAGDGLASFVTVGLGSSKRYARLTIRPVVRNLAQVKASYKASALVAEHGCEAVSFLDQIAEMIVALRSDMKAAMLEGEFSPATWEAKVAVRRQKCLDEHTRLPGQSNKGDEVIHGRMETHTLQVAIELPSVADGVENYHTLVALANAVDGMEFPDPLCAGHVVRPYVGCTSKSSPMSVAYLLKKGQQLPSHVYAVNQFIGNTDRISRESGTPLQAKRLASPAQVITNGKGIGQLAERRLDAVWAVVNGVNAGLISSAQYNADQGSLTPQGSARYTPAPMKYTVNGITKVQLDALCAEYGFGNLADMEEAGWVITDNDRPIPGKYGHSGIRLCEKTYTVVTPLEAPKQSLYKIWLSGGHKFLAPTTRKNYYVIVEGQKIWIDGMVSQETMVGFPDADGWDGGKKQDLTVMAGLLSLLGKHDWKGEEHLTVASLKEDVELSLAMHDLPLTGHLSLYDEDDNCVGDCIPMLLPSYVCYEDDRCSKVSLRMKRSLNLTRLLGETINISKTDEIILQGLADTAAGKAPKGVLCPVAFSTPEAEVDEYHALYPWLGVETMPFWELVCKD